MQVKTFEAVDMKQALQLVKDELGPRAVIVSSRSVRRDGGLFGLLGRRVLEITAATESGAPAQTPEARGVAPTAAAPAGPRGGGSRGGRGTGAYHDIWAVKQAVDPVLDEVRALREAVQAPVGSDTSTEDLRSDIVQIRTILSSLVGQAGFGADAEGAAAQRLYYFLLARGIDEPLARSLVQRVVARVETGALADLDRLKLNLAAEMRADLSRAARGAAPSPVQIFVGPTGVGKTTTIAKLAARSQRDGGDALIVTTDVHRVAAVEQMVRFGELISVPVEVAIGPEDLRRTIERNAARDQIFVDTAGRNHRDAASMRALQGLVSAVDDREILLVCSATARATDSREILDAHADLAWSRLVMTRLDETRTHGELFNNVVRSGRPIACVTTGQSVPEHLESIDVPGILRKVLHG